MECLGPPLRGEAGLVGRAGVRDLYAEQLRKCTCLADGRQIHARIASRGLSGNRFLCNLLVQMYGRCGGLEEATECFNTIADANVFSWTILIAANAQNGQGTRTLVLLHRMHLEGIRPNRVTFVAASAGCGNFSQARLLYEQASLCGFGGDERISNSLVSLYGKWGRFEEARRVFNAMQHRDVIAWTSLVWAYAENGQGEAAVQLFEVMCCEGVKPDAVCFVAILDAVAVAGDQSRCRMVHSLVSEIGWSEAEVVQLQNTLINMYAKCTLLDDAILVFENMGRRDTVSWNSAIAAYAQNGQADSALGCFATMALDGGAAPSNVTFVVAAAAAGETGRRQWGDALHSCACEAGLVDGDAIVRSALLGMYGRRGDAERAAALVRPGDAASSTTMVTVFSKLGRPAEAVLVFRTMLLWGLRPGKAALVSALYAAGCLSTSVAVWMERSCVASSSLSNEVEVVSSMVGMYSRLGEVEEARRVFDSMVPWTRDEMSWTSIIGAYTQQQRQHQQQQQVGLFFQEALLLFRRMQLDGVKPNKVTMVVLMDACATAGDLVKAELFLSYARELGIDLSSSYVLNNCLLNLYVRRGYIDQAREMLLHGMASRDLTSWNTVMGGLADEGRAAEAVLLLSKMEAEGEEAPDAVTLTHVLDACTTTGDLDTGSALHDRLVAQGYFTSAMVTTALVNLYARCGDLGAARRVFDAAVEGGSDDVVLWNSMLAGYARGGALTESRELFHTMALAGVAADKNSFVSLLVACSHAGLQNEAKEQMVSMGPDFGVSVAEEHWTCVVDLLGRRGRLADAGSLLHQMPFLPDAATCTTFLSWCKAHGDAGRAEPLLRRLLEIEPRRSSAYVLLSRPV